MKKNIVIEYIKNAFLVSSHCYWDLITTKWMQILKNSNYPDRFIRKIISSVWNDVGTESISSELGETDGNPTEICRERYGNYTLKEKLLKPKKIKEST